MKLFVGGMVVILGGKTADGKTSSVIQLGDNCADIPDLPVAVERHSSTVLNGDIVTCGGYSGRGWKDTCYSITPEHGGEWRKATSLKLPYHVFGHTMNTVGNTMVLVGGGISRLRYTDKTWTSDGRSWVPGPVMTTPRLHHCSVSTSSNMVVVSGSNGRKPLSLVESVDIIANKTTILPSLLTARYNHGCTVVNIDNTDTIIVAGGYNPTDKVLTSVEIMSPLGTNWRMMTSLPSPRCLLTLVTIGDKVRLLGGGDDEYNFPPDVLELSDLSGNATWKVIPAENVARWLHTAIVLTC